MTAAVKLCKRMTVMNLKVQRKRSFPVDKTPHRIGLNTYICI